MAEHASKARWIRDALSRYERPLLGYAVRLTGDPDRARDVVQETFLHLCQADHRRIEHHLAAWLFRVCRNRALDIARKENRVEPLNATTEEALASPEPGPGVLAERREGAASVREIVATLPEKQRQVVFLRFREGLSYREISEATGHSVSHVGVLLHTAVKTIREQLESATVAVACAGRTRAGGAS